MGSPPGAAWLLKAALAVPAGVAPAACCCLAQAQWGAQQAVAALAVGASARMRIERLHVDSAMVMKIQLCVLMGRSAEEERGCVRPRMAQDADVTWALLHARGNDQSAVASKLRSRHRITHLCVLLLPSLCSLDSELMRGCWYRAT